MPIKRYNGSSWDVVAGAGVQGATGASGNTTVNSKGDLLTFDTAAARLPVGTNGQTLVADSSASTGLRWQDTFAAGKNKIINGDFRINQRNFTSTTSDTTYTFDRWITEGLGVGDNTWSAQTFTPGTAPVSGYEAINFIRLASTGQTLVSDYCLIDQRVEDVRTLAGQTVTLSFWAKASTGTPKVGAGYLQNFGSGGSGQVNGTIGDVTITTSWARYSVTATLPSVSGKTIGTSSFLRALIWTSAGSNYAAWTNIGLQNATIDIWGVQLEAGSTATAFQTATGNPASELAACQRYYFRQGGNTYSSFGQGYVYGSGGAMTLVKTPVTMRVVPTAVDYAGTIHISDFNGGSFAVSSISISSVESSKDLVFLATNSSGMTTGRGSYTRALNDASAYVGLSAEL